MTTKSKLGVAAGCLLASSLLIPSAANAQRMAGGAPSHAAVPMARARVVTARPPAVRATRPVNAGTFSTPGFGGGNFGNFGNGFGPNLGIEAAIDPATQWRIAIAERLARFQRPFAGSGFYLLNGGYPVYPVADDSAGGDPVAYPGQSQQPIIIVQQAPQDQTAQSGKTVGSVAREDVAPLQDVGQFTLVLHNGARIEAIGFTRMGDKIVYITAGGSRRTMAAADLDADATRQVNEERGTPLQLGI